MSKTMAGVGDEAIAIEHKVVQEEDEKDFSGWRGWRRKMG